MPSWRISGEISSKKIFVIDATFDPAANEDQVRAMFQSLLEDRFKLMTHRAKKEANGYALSVVKKGPRIQPAKSDDPAAPLPEWFRERGAVSAQLEGRVISTIEEAGVRTVTGRRASIRQLCDALELFVGTFVIDETGMQGSYYFVLRFVRDDYRGDVDVATLFRAIQDDLGLKLEKKRAPIEFLLVDGVDSSPTEN
jgi:uncharacterized protein (TIGR03435 family)